jgi:hypothetical protein
MKKIILFLSVLLISTNFFAQELISEEIPVLDSENQSINIEENIYVLPKNEIELKIGYFPFPESIVGAFTGISVGGNPKTFSIPSFTFQYLRFLNEKNALGASFTFGTPFIFVGDETKSSFSYAALQAKYKGFYLRNKTLALFGEISIGADILMQYPPMYATPFFAYQIIPFGIEFGGENLYASTSIGVGSEGSVLILGIGYRF